jgi:hypothetical protein
VSPFSSTKRRTQSLLLTEPRISFRGIASKPGRGRAGHVCLTDLGPDDLEEGRNRCTQGDEAISEDGQIAKTKSLDLVAEPCELIGQNRDLALDRIHQFSLGHAKRLLCHVFSNQVGFTSVIPRTC